MRGEHAADAFGEIHVAGLGRPRADELRAEHGRADSLQRAGDPSGLRVNCTAEASARNSRCRETAALMRLPKNMPTKPSTMNTRPMSSRYSDAVVLARPAAAAEAGDAQQLAADQAHQQDAVQHADQPQVEPHVAVEDVAELVGDDALQLVARELLGTAARDADDGVAGREAGGERVDALLLVEQKHGRHGHAGGEGHFLDDVQQPALDGIGRVRINAPAAEPLGDDGAAAGQLSDLEQAAAADERKRPDARRRAAPRCGIVRRLSAAPSAIAVATNVVPTMPITASTNITTSHFVLRRATA